MSIKEEKIEKTIVLRDLKEKKIIGKYDKVEDQNKPRFFKKLKRKYRLMLVFLFCLSLILIFMILPMVIGAFIQGIWR